VGVSSNFVACSTSLAGKWLELLNLAMNALDVSINPPLPERAKAAMPRSISPASRILIGVNSTPSAGATDWIAPNWPVPDDMAAPPTARRLVCPRQYIACCA